MLLIITFVVGTLGTVLLGFPAIALGSFTSWGLREERSPMGGLVPGTLGYNVAMIGSWAIQGGVEFFLAFLLLKALG